jgi:cell division protein FtsQ
MKMKAKGAILIKKRQSRSMKLDWLGYLKPVSMAVTIACILISTVLLIMQLVNKDITELKIDGPFEHVSKNQIRSELEGVFPAGFITLNIENVVERLLVMPMVSQVEAEKIWPNTLKLTVHEEKPVAIWNQKNMLSQVGEILPLALAQLQLPQLKGRSGESRIVMQHYQLFNHWGKRHELTLQALNSTASGWQLIYENDFQIWLDSAQAMKGLQQLEDVLYQFDVERIQRIDLRYEQGFSVAWKEKELTMGREKEIII